MNWKSNGNFFHLHQGRIQDFLGGGVDKKGGVKCTKQQKVMTSCAAYTAGGDWAFFLYSMKHFTP